MKPVKWEEITNLHPSRFVLVEAIKVSSSNHVRQLEDMAVIQDYDNPQEAWNGYKELHKLHPTRELYVYSIRAETMLRPWRNYSQECGSEHKATIATRFAYHFIDHKP
ncbi:hypothetical protein [Paenibacillus sp. NPDC057934]|uniref:hypothetical protein n=1 Tax=Paenibacillus sp. NPDC057934 TaxID=3346282 RepID=UPI0036DAC100